MLTTNLSMKRSIFLSSCTLSRLVVMLKATARMGMSASKVV